MFNKAEQSRPYISVLKKYKPEDKNTEASADQSPRSSPRLSPRHTVTKKYKFKPNAADAHPFSSTSVPNTEPRLRALSQPAASRTEPDPYSILHETFAEYGAQPSFFDLMNSDDAPVLKISPPKDWVFSGKLAPVSPPGKKRSAEKESDDSPLKKKRKIEEKRAHSIAIDHMIKRRKETDSSPLSSPRTSENIGSPRASEKNSTTTNSLMTNSLMTNSPTANSTSVNSTTVVTADAETHGKSSMPSSQ